MYVCMYVGGYVCTRAQSGRGTKKIDPFLLMHFLKATGPRNYPERGGPGVANATTPLWPVHPCVCMGGWMVGWMDGCCSSTKEVNL